MREVQQRERPSLRRSYRQCQEAEATYLTFFGFSSPSSALSAAFDDDAFAGAFGAALAFGAGLSFDTGFGGAFAFVLGFGLTSSSDSESLLSAWGVSSVVVHHPPVFCPLQSSGASHTPPRSQSPLMPSLALPRAS